MATPDEISSAYQSLFGRSPDAGGLEFWQSQGKTGDDLINALTGAAQGSDRTSIVQNNYSDLFGRQGESAGVDFWSNDNAWNQYASGGLDNLRVAMGSNSVGQDEFDFMRNLKTTGDSDWASVFYKPEVADNVWKSLLDDDGFTGQTRMPKIDELLKALQRPQQSSGGGGSASGGGYRDYMNPYIEDVLNSSIRKVGEAGDKARNQLGASAFMSGAYGDARHGVESDNLTQSLMETIGDLSATTNAQGFESAMGWNNRDLDRQSNIAYQNAMLQNNWMGNQISGANTANNVGLNDFATNTNWLSFLQNQDKYDRDWTQQGLNTNYQDFWAQQNWEQNQLVALLNVLNAIPGQSSSTATSQTPDNSWASMLGSSLSGLGGSSGGYSAPSWLI